MKNKNQSNQADKLLLFFALLHTAADYGNFLRDDFVTAVTDKITVDILEKTHNNASYKYKRNKINQGVKLATKEYDHRLKVMDTFINQTNDNNNDTIRNIVAKVGVGLDDCYDTFTLDHYAALLGLTNMFLDGLNEQLSAMLERETNKRNVKLVKARYKRLYDALDSSKASDLWLVLGKQENIQSIADTFGNKIISIFEKEKQTV